MGNYLQKIIKSSRLDKAWLAWRRETIKTKNQLTL
jgi:hypothetical protein